MSLLSEASADFLPCLFCASSSCDYCCVQYYGGDGHPPQTLATHRRDQCSDNLADTFEDTLFDSRARTAEVGNDAVVDHICMCCGRASDTNHDIPFHFEPIRCNLRISYSVHEQLRVEQPFVYPETAGIQVDSLLCLGSVSHPCQDRLVIATSC